MEELKRERHAINRRLTIFREQGNTEAETAALKQRKRINKAIANLREKLDETGEREAKRRRGASLNREKFSMVRKTSERKYTEPFLSNVDLMYQLSRQHFRPASVSRLSPEFLRSFGWTG